MRPSQDPTYVGSKLDNDPFMHPTFVTPCICLCILCMSTLQVGAYILAETIRRKLNLFC